MMKKLKKPAQKTKIIFFKKIFFLLFLIIIYSLLVINLYFSQTISPLYLKLVDSDKTSYVDFLKKIKSLSVFSEELKKAETVFGKKIINDVFQEEKELETKINQLESALQKNPNSRDVLYALYKLYLKKGNQQKAETFLKKAKEIDPLINN